MNSIIRYIISREVYSTYMEHRNEFWGLFTFTNLGKLFLFVFLAFFLFAFTWAFSQKNKVKPDEIHSGENLMANKWKNYFKDEIPIYQWAIQKDAYSDEVDTIFAYVKSIKVDSTIRGKTIGVVGDQIKRNEQGIFIKFKIDKSIKASKPNQKDITAIVYEEKLNKTSFVSIDDIMLTGTKPPESRWPFFFASGIFVIFFFRRFFNSFQKIFKKRIPIYEKSPVYKHDKRFKSGKRLSHYEMVFSKYRDMTNEELSLHRKQHGSRLIFYGLFFVLTAWYLYYLWVS